MPPSLRHAIARLQRAWRLRRAYLYALWGIVVGLGLLDALFLLARLRPLLHQHTLLLFVPLLPAAAGGLAGLAALLWPTPRAAIVRHLDRQLRLADRLTTAWELAAGITPTTPQMRQLQFRETLHRLRSVDSRRLLSLRPPRGVVHGLLLLLLALIPLIALPNPQEAVLVERERLQAATEAAAAQLEAAAQALESDPALDEATRREAEQILAEAQAKLNDPHATAEEKMRALAEAERRLEGLRSPEADALVRHLSEAAPLSTEEVVRPLARALEQGDVEAAASYLRSLADSEEGRPLSPEELTALADALAQMADTLATTEPEVAEQLRQASEALYNGDTASAKEALRSAAASFERAAQAQAPNQALQQAQAQLQQARTEMAQASSGQGAADSASSQPGNATAGNTSGPAGPRGGTQGSGTSRDGTASGGHSEDSGSGAPYGEENGRLEERGETITIPRKETLGSGGSPSEATPGSSRIPYREIYAAYRREAEATLSREPLPPALRTYVRSYFASLEP